MKNSEKHPSVSKVKYYIKFGVVGAGITLIWLMFLVPVIIYHLPQEVLKELYFNTCLLYTSPSPRDATLSRMPSSA